MPGSTHERFTQGRFWSEYWAFPLAFPYQVGSLQTSFNPSHRGWHKWCHTGRVCIWIQDRLFRGQSSHKVVAHSNIGLNYVQENVYRAFRPVATHRTTLTLYCYQSFLEKLRCLRRFRFNLEKISYSGLLFDGASFLFYNIPSNFASGPSYGRFVFWRFSNFDEIFNFVLPEFSIFSRSFILTFNFLVWGAMVAVCLLLLTFALPWTWTCLRVRKSWSPC